MLSVVVTMTTTITITTPSSPVMLFLCRRDHDHDHHHHRSIDQERDDRSKGGADDEESKVPVASPTSGVSLLKLRKLVKGNRLTVDEEKMIVRHGFWPHVWGHLGESLVLSLWVSVSISSASSCVLFCTVSKQRFLRSPSFFLFICRNAW